MVKIHTIYLDMDGVIVDFFKGFKKLTGEDPMDFENEHGIKEFFKALDKGGKDYWTGLEWTEDGRRLWSYLKKYNPVILSSPTHHHTSKAGKHEWIGRNLVIPRRRVILDSKKDKYAMKGALLIDDRDSNTIPFKRKGGEVILHKNTHDTIRQLKKMGI